MKKMFCLIIAFILLAASPPVQASPGLHQPGESQYSIPGTQYFPGDKTAGMGKLAAQTAISLNSNAPANIIGVSETRDVAALFFSFYETYLKSSADGDVNFADIPYLLSPAMLLLPAFSGGSIIVKELQALTDEQIKILCTVADEYSLGQHKERAKQVFKTILVLAQTYFVFSKPIPTQ